jgi:hydroxyacylglutathione hydrolase
MLDAPVADVGDAEAGYVEPLHASQIPKRMTCRAQLWRLLYPVRYLCTVLAFLTAIFYMMFVGIFQGMGMLAMMLVMPSFMKLVYPSRVGQLHSWFLGTYRQCFMGEDGHSRSIRIDLDAADSSSMREERGGGGSSAPASPARAADEAAAPLWPYSVHTIACLVDNYSYLIVDRSGPAGRPRPAALVDPCDASAVLLALTKLSEKEYVADGGVRVEAILTTHHHWDHAGGNRVLAKRLAPVRVYGGKDDSVAGCTHTLSDGDALTVGNLTVRALHAPCHTRGSLCFVIAGPTPALFGGDTLFCGGCGAPFEGTQTEMAYNFAKIWRLCPQNTLIFPGHEYSTTILPGYFSGNPPLPDHPAAFSKLCALLWRCQQLRMLASPVPTVPLVLADELVINSNFGPLRRAAETLVHAYMQHLAFSWHRQAMAESRSPAGAVPRMQREGIAERAAAAAAAALAAQAARAAEQLTQTQTQTQTQQKMQQQQQQQRSESATAPTDRAGISLGSIAPVVAPVEGGSSSSSGGGGGGGGEEIHGEGLQLTPLMAQATKPPSPPPSPPTAAATAPNRRVLQPWLSSPDAEHALATSAAGGDRGGGGDDDDGGAGGEGGAGVALDFGIASGAAASFSGAAHDVAHAGGSYWNSAGVVVLPTQELQALEHLIRTERCAAALRQLQRLRATGMIMPTSAADGCPTNARVYHADPPRCVGWLGPPEDFGIVTTDEVKAAFGLLEAEEAPAHARVEVLRRLMMSSLLLKRPLEQSQVDHLFQLVGVDGRGLVSCARFNGQLGVLPPMPPPPKRRGCLCLRFGSRQRDRYDDAPDDDSIASECI